MTKAEFYREIGDMQSAKNILDMVKAENNFRKELIASIRERIDHNDCAVFKL